MYDILVVDDEPMICEGLKLILEMKGYKTRVAMDGQEAITLFNQSPPDLVITDIIMPEKDGIEVICNIKNKNPKIKIIAISGGGRISANDHLCIAQRLGASSVLTKPFSSNDLIDEINKVFAE